MNESVLFFSEKIEKKYNVYLNYDICELIQEKINYNMFQINLTREKIKSKLKRYDKLLNLRSPKVFDSYILHKKKMYRKLLLKINNDEKTRYNIINNIEIYNE